MRRFSHSLGVQTYSSLPAAMAAMGPAVAASPGKKLHGRAFYESLGSPKFVLAPMVDQSEFVRRRRPALASLPPPSAVDEDAICPVWALRRRR